MRTRRLPFDLLIPEPCQEDWNAMRDGGVARRHCERCQTGVVDVSLLTGPELQRLTERTGGDFCARLTRLPDGALLLRETPSSMVSAASLLRGPVLAGAVLAGTAMTATAQSHAHPAAPTLSCAEVTALKHPEAAQASLLLPQDRSAMQAPAPAPAPPQQQVVGRTITLGKPAVPTVPLHGTVRLPQGRTVRNGLVYTHDTRGNSRSFQVKPDGSYDAALIPGKYTLRADVRADDGELYATVWTATVTGRPMTVDLVLQGPVAVTAGAPIAVPGPASNKR